MTQEAHHGRPHLRPGRSAAPLAAEAPVTALGLKFANPLGLAAGFDRTGELAPFLRAYGFGHVEIGTLTPETGHAGVIARARGGSQLGVNIGSARSGLDDQVVEDYLAMLRQTARVADYVVANLSASNVHRDGNTPRVDMLVKRLSTGRDVLSAVLGRHVPLLLKLEAGSHGASFPAAIMAARAHGIDGVVLVSDCVRRIEAICAYLDRMTVISVGGIRTADDAVARLAAGAALVQVHRAFADGGTAQIFRILAGITTPRSRKA